MSVLETLKKGITGTGKFAAEKAKTARDIFRTSEQIRSNKKEIRTLTYKIGQTYLDLHGEDYEEEFADFIRGIAEAKAEMAEKEQELTRLKAQVKDFDFDDDDEDEIPADFFEEEPVEEAPVEEAECCKADDAECCPAEEPECCAADDTECCKADDAECCPADDAVEEEAE